MEYGAEVRIEKDATDERIARRKGEALLLLARRANVSVDQIDTSRLEESRRDDPSGDWFYQVRVDIRVQRSASVPFLDLDDLRTWIE